ISSENRKFQQLVKNLCDYAKVGIHPSYASYDEPELLKNQLKKLKSVINKPIYRSRFHYLRFSLPNSFRVLIENKITEDFSMGYSASTGFRAGISNGFNFYDLEYDYETKLRLFPFVIMDTALKTYLKLSPQEAKSQIKNLIDEVRSVDGYFISLWHNESLSNRYDWKGWKEVYEWMIDYISKYDRLEINKT
ncbi:MAG: polysaccharide deacetylase family protein, partial [Bacteroidales bacterium]|nr:polysaccharide deacetylase family protein [Bacteroidales bacterium]